LHPSKLTINAGGQGTIGLYDGYDFQRRLLELSATPSEIISWGEAPTGYPSDRIMTIYGRGAGITTLNACEEYNPAAVWCYIQVEVLATSVDLETLVRRNTYLGQEFVQAVTRLKIAEDNRLLFTLAHAYITKKIVQ
jgi:hypothetical protein